LTVKLDFDNVSLSTVRYWVSRSMRWYHLRGFIILESSPHCNHVVFDRTVTWTENVKIMAWVALMTKHRKPRQSPYTHHPPHRSLEGRGMRRCWNQIYVQTLQRSMLSLRPCGKRVGVTDPEIVSRRHHPEMNEPRETDGMMTASPIRLSG
jgi:hypothetical protein